MVWVGVVFIDQVIVVDYYYCVGVDVFVMNIVVMIEGIVFECFQCWFCGLLGMGLVGVGLVFGQGREGEYQGQCGEGVVG